MAYVVVFWTEDQQYSVVSSSKVHGDVVEEKETLVDWDERRKGAKAINSTAYPAKIIKIGGRCTCCSFSVIILFNFYKYHAQQNHDQLLLESNQQKLKTINSGRNEI